VILEFLGDETEVHRLMSNVVESIDYLLDLLQDAPDDFKQTVVSSFEALQELYLDLEENQNLLTPGRRHFWPGRGLLPGHLLLAGAGRW